MGEWGIYQAPDVAHLNQPLIPLHPSLSFSSPLSVLADDHTWNLLIQFAVGRLKLNAPRFHQSQPLWNLSGMPVQLNKGLQDDTHLPNTLQSSTDREEKERKGQKKKAKIQTVFDFPGEVINLRKHVHAKSTSDGV